MVGKEGGRGEGEEKVRKKSEIVFRKKEWDEKTRWEILRCG